MRDTDITTSPKDEMMTTIDDVQRRVKAAEAISADFRGERQDGLTWQTAGDWVVIEDGNDKWLARTRDVQAAIEDVVSDILDGNYDSNLDDLVDVSASAYDRICSTCPYVYSCNGGGTLKDIISLGLADTTQSSIIDYLGLEDEYEEYLQSQDD